MKKLVSILVLVFAFTLTSQAQKKRGNRHPKLSVEQQTNLAIKKMTLALDLSEKQQSQIRPIVKAKITDRKATMKKRKATKERKEKPTADEIYAMKGKHLDKQILLKKQMKDILNEEQYEKFERMKKGREMKGKKKMKMRKGAKIEKRKKS